MRGAALRLAAGLLLCAAPGFAQISPGPLSKSHAALEGNSQCLKCHQARKGVSAEKCLVCHALLRDRLAAGKGLHARPPYKECKTCHMDHQGVAFDLVYWGQAGRAAFDHRETGYPLAGKHTTLSCETCHPAKLTIPKDRWAAQGLSARSYLGLGTTCTSCHADEHRGQFAGRECTACHNQAAWKPAPGFDHRKSAYPLTGLHLGVPCTKCHQALASGGEKTTPQYKGVAFKDCAACHQDPHKGRFGATCASCHQTSGWKRTDRTAFDHEKTRYPLRGRHAALVCDRCHTPGKPLSLPFARCTDCHTDSHLGQFARRSDQGRCESCHDVSGFRPARYAMDEHQKTAYPLTGAHRAVPCDACHKALSGDARRRIPGVRVAAGSVIPFRFASTRCLDCHRDPHRGQVDRYLKAGGCESCHVTESWREARVDHAKTRFPLTGGHARTSCAACHRKAAAPGAAPAALVLTGIPVTCEACHQDPHRGQFVANGKLAACDRCHTTENLKATRFAHNRDSVYALDGAHARVPCAACHRAETRSGVTFIRYKPLPTTCKGCHGATSGKEGMR